MINRAQDDLLEISLDHYGQDHVNAQERAHVAKIKKATTRLINALMIDELVPVKHSITKPDETTTEIDAVYLVQYHDGATSDLGTGHARDRDSFFLVRGTLATWQAKVEQAIAADAALHHAGEESGSEPATLGYAFANSNDAVTALVVTDIDSFEQIEFRVRAGSTTKAALAVAEPFSIRVDRTSIPVNSNPVLGSKLEIAVSGADSIAVSRSVDGATLYFVGQDGAATFGISLIGHE